MDTSLFREAERFCCPASTWTVQKSLNNPDAGRPLAQGCPALLIDSPTGHCTNTGTNSFSLWLSSCLHLFTQDTLDGTNGVRIIEVPL